MKNIQLSNHKSYLRQSCRVLVENKLEKEEKYFGRTETMTPVKFESDSCKPGELINVEISSFNENGLFGFHKTNKVKAA